MKTICGLDCEECIFKNECEGCVKSGGKPFGELCPVAICCFNKKMNFCEECKDTPCKLRHNLMEDFNALGISDMGKVTNLNVLKGSYVNLEYELPNGQKIKFLNDNKLYFGNKIEKANSERCYGIIADEKFLLVSEYRKDGVEPKIVIYKERV